MKITAKLSGLEDVKRRLEAVNAALRKTILRKATTAGGQILSREVKARAPRETGLLRRSISYKIRSYDGGARFLAVVGPRSGIKEAVVTLGGTSVLARSKKGKALLAAGGETSFRAPVRYAHLLEFGTSKSAAQPFMRTAIASAHDRIVEAMRQVIEAGITAALSSAA